MFLVLVWLLLLHLLDQIGPITRTVEDNAYLLQAISGYDPMDSTSANVDVPNFVEALTGDIKGLKIAVPKEYLEKVFSEAVRQSVLDALKVLEGLGATWEEVSLATFKICVGNLLFTFFIRGFS